MRIVSFPTERRNSHVGHVWDWKEHVLAMFGGHKAVVFPSFSFATADKFSGPVSGARRQGVTASLHVPPRVSDPVGPGGEVGNLHF